MSDKLTNEAIEVWNAGVDAVRGSHVIEDAFIRSNNLIIIDDQIEVAIDSIDQIIVLGAGKAAAGMAEGFASFWSEFGTDDVVVRGWLNVPNGSFTNSLKDSLTSSKNFSIQLHAAREAGANEPSEAGVYGTEQILDLAAQANERTLVLFFISGGASALLPAPISGLSLEEKLELTRFFARSGASIEAINEVRRCLSKIKGGGLARSAARAHQIVSLIISDVLGDPLHIIGSGPTITDPKPDPVRALQVLEQWDPHSTLPPNIRSLIRSQLSEVTSKTSTEHPLEGPRLSNVILGNNATAVDAAGVRAVNLGYAYWMESNRTLGEPISKFAETLMRGIELAVASDGPNCLILGGEPTIRLPDQDTRGQGGRNQQLALELLHRLQKHSNPRLNACQGIAIVCGGTDGEDGPTTAAGAVVNQKIMARAKELALDSQDYLDRCDAYNFFSKVDGLLITGPTNTNVCDLSVVLIER